ncbi:uncharacterized protein LOC113472304 isoform X2 [Diaphorina citri]|uniref:Uncharacterized protein LOC113472304 isoform X1 n=1 Tax=Diaphorina citri TaxID=121845 RepID=A0A3Q0JH94_DIACI|nr:uncharacterized protein LOC113472304 isoform X1 [Diaphorina citri]XP_026687798.1 uncharacterized protein LOC113472304 isoform X2 [Diaphorina citri]
MEKCWTKFFPDVVSLPQSCKAPSPPPQCHPMRQATCPFSEALKLTQNNRTNDKLHKNSIRLLNLAEDFYPKKKVGHKTCVKSIELVPRGKGFMWCSNPNVRAQSKDWRCRKPGEISKEVKAIIDDIKRKKEEMKKKKEIKFQPENTEEEMTASKQKFAERMDLVRTKTIKELRDAPSVEGKHKVAEKCEKKTCTKTEKKKNKCSVEAHYQGKGKSDINKEISKSRSNIIKKSKGKKSKEKKSKGKK